MQTKEGALKIRLRKWGILREDYEANLAAGRKYCPRCGGFKPFAAFHKDPSKHDDLSGLCGEHLKETRKKRAESGTIDKRY